MTNLLTKDTLSIDMGEEIKRYDVKITCDTTEFKKTLDSVIETLEKAFPKYLPVQTD